MPNQHQEIGELINSLYEKKGFDLHMLIGVDGFVDSIIHVVDRRQDFENYTRIETISDFGKRILNAAGLSANLEFVTMQTKLGGNGPIYSNALIEYGVKLTYFGAVGDGAVHPVFSNIEQKGELVYPLVNPGLTDCLEFLDGKLMLGKHISLAGITWEAVLNAFGGAAALAQKIAASDLFGMENWTMIPRMNDIWNNIIKEVFPLLPDRRQKSVAFFDLADPEKRTKEDISEAMALIGKFEQKFHAILGLNEKEIYEIADVMGVNHDGVSRDQLEKTTRGVYDKLGIYCLVVHPTKEAVCVVNGEFYQADGPYCARPVLTTGAGDNFNAGFCLGQALGLDPKSALLLGVGTSGYYVRNAHSPSYAQELGFLEEWQAGEV
jgi:sugar/nucleoside kinase (ribokinase family)